jgi:hypothetical protein
MRKPAGLHPPHFAVSPSDPKLARIALRIGGIERRFDGCPNPLHVVRMQPLDEFFDIRLVLGNLEQLFQACIHQATRWIGSYCHHPRLLRRGQSTKACSACLRALRSWITAVRRNDRPNSSPMTFTVVRAQITVPFLWT